jgi:hypothetical protein
LPDRQSVILLSAHLYTNGHLLSATQTLTDNTQTGKAAFTGCLPLISHPGIPI